MHQPIGAKKSSFTAHTMQLAPDRDAFVCPAPGVTLPVVGSDDSPDSLCLPPGAEPIQGRLFATPTAVSTTLLVASVVVGACSLFTSQVVQTQTLRAQTHVAQIARLDESLTASARYAAFTGEAQFMRRHKAEAAQLQQVLRQADAPFLTSANRARLATERRACDMALQHPAQARALLATPAYEAQRKGFTIAYKQWQEGTKERGVRVQNAVAFGVVASGGLGVAACLLFGGAGTVAARQSRKLRGELSTARFALKNAEQALAAARHHRETAAREMARLAEEKVRAERMAIGAEETRERKLTLLEKAVEAANDVVLIGEADGVSGDIRVVRVNRAFEDMTGYTQSEIRGQSPLALQGKDTDPDEVARVRGLLKAGKPVQAELLNYRKDNAPFWVEMNIQPIRADGDEITYWISVQRDVTERKRAAEEIWWRANYDALTGLPNRDMYRSRLEKAIVETTPDGPFAGVLFFDLDRFKQINDTLGHGTGDALLQLLAKRLQAVLQPEDTLARMSGDEFTVLLPRLAKPEDATPTAQKLLDALDLPFEVDGHELFVTASIGVSVAPRDGRDIETLLKNADTAMYRAKDGGRDSYRVYNQDMNARALDHLQLESHFRRALERGELFMVYQPQVNLLTGQVFGVEALMRWESPTLGRVSPGQFIPLAEALGDKFMSGLGEWSLQEACLQAARFTEAGRSLRVSVNLSARQFQQSDLPKSVEQALRVSGVSPELLDIEITETTLVNIKQSRETLRRLKDLGVRLSVDDFGIGYSSLSYLRTLPLDVLKIDRLFVNDLGQDHKGESVVLRLVELAHDLGLEVIAEGVENEAQRSRLQRMGCDAMQGYLFSPPTTAADVIGLVENAERSQSSNALPLVAASSDISLSPLIAALSNSPVTEQASEALPTRVATVSTTGKPTKTARSKSGRTRADVAQGVEEAVLVLSRGRWKDGSG